MVNEQVGYEGIGKRRGGKVALDKAEVHDKEEARVTILRITGMKTFNNTDQNSKLEE